jgi:hypothetical protein
MLTQEETMVDPIVPEAAGLTPGETVRIHTDDPTLEDVNGMTGHVVHCEDPEVGSGTLAYGCLVELDDSPRHAEPRRVWVTIDKLVRL